MEQPQAMANVGEPIQQRIDRMKLSISRLETLGRCYPDLTIKQDPMKDIYQSKSIWKEVENLEILQGSNTLKVLPYKNVKITYHGENALYKTYESEYRIYTDPMEICLVGFYWKMTDDKRIDSTHTVIQIQDYMSKLGTNLYSDSLLKKIEYELYKYLRKTIIADPKNYSIENDHLLPQKLQTLITFQ